MLSKKTFLPGKKSSDNLKIVYAFFSDLDYVKNQMKKKLMSAQTLWVLLNNHKNTTDLLYYCKMANTPKINSFLISELESS